MTLDLKTEFAYVDKNLFYENKQEGISYQYVWVTKMDRIDSVLIRMDITKYTKEERTKITEIMNQLIQWGNYISWFLPVKSFKMGKFEKKDELWIVCGNSQTSSLDTYLQTTIIVEEEQRYMINQWRKMTTVLQQRKMMIHFNIKDTLMRSEANDFRPTFRITAASFILNIKKKSTMPMLTDSFAILLGCFVVMNKTIDAEGTLKTNTEYNKLIQMIKRKESWKEMEKNPLVIQAKSENEIRTFNMKDIEPIEIIGFGAYGTIIKVKYQGKIYSLKESDNEKIVEIEKESLVLDLCQHEKIMKCHGIASSWKSITLQLQHKRQKRRKSLYLLLDYYGNGNFDQFMDTYTKQKKRMTKDEIGHFLRELLIPIYYLQKTKKYLHADIKPENYMVLYPNQQPNDELPKLVLTDFGNCRTFSNESPCVRGTSKDYDSSRRHPLTINHDIYPIGVSIYRMLTNKMPFGDNEEQVQENISNTNSIKFPKFVTKKEELTPFVELTRMILTFDAESRITFEQLWEVPIVKELLNL